MQRQFQCSNSGYSIFTRWWKYKFERRLNAGSLTYPLFILSPESFSTESKSPQTNNELESLDVVCFGYGEPT